MRRDETPNETPNETPMEHLDEGTVHAWLDGALSADEAARAEAHVAECGACAELVAEARGLIAGASRIVGALDVVPGGVIPATTPAAEPVVPIATAQRPVARPRRWALRGAAAFVVMVGGTTLVMRSAWAPSQAGRPYDATAARSVSMAPGPSEVTADSAVPAAASPATSAAPPAAAPPAAPLEAPMMAPMTTPAPAPRMDAVPPTTAPSFEQRRVMARVPTTMSARREAPSAAPKVTTGSIARDSVAQATGAAGAAGARAGKSSAFTPLSGVTPTGESATASVTAPSPPVRSIVPAPSGAARAARGMERASAVAADAVERAHARAESVAGCYAIAGGASGWPEQVELQSVALPPGARRGYVARVVARADSGYWAPLPADSLRVVWFAGAGGVDARLGPAGDGTLRGVARPFATTGADATPRPLVVRRIGCPPR